MRIDPSPAGSTRHPAHPSARLLDVDSVIPFLVELALLPRRDLFDRPVTAAAVSRRNRNLRVLVGDRGFFVKQSERTLAGAASLRREITFYRSPGTAPLRALGGVPSAVWSDPSRPMLVLELLAGHQGLWEHYRAVPPPRFPVAMYRALGVLLAGIHRASLGPLTSPPEDGPSSVPWVFTAHEPPPEALVNMSPAAGRALTIVQASPALRVGIREALDDWEADAVIHGDLRADNVLVRTSDDVNLSVVDWELVRPGDRLWDVATVAQDLLLYWVGGLDVGSSGRPADLASVSAAATVPWPVIQPALAALWQAYVDESGPTVDSGPQTLTKLVRFTAVRSVQSVLEMAEGRPHLVAHAVLLLQLAANLISDPLRAARDLFGIA